MSILGYIPDFLIIGTNNEYLIMFYIIRTCVSLATKSLDKLYFYQWKWSTNLLPFLGGTE